MRKHLTLNDINPVDYKYIEKPDKNFSPERNYRIVQETIVKAEKMQAQLGKIRNNKDAQERIDVLSSYARYRMNKGDKKLDKYMGKEWMKRIYGEKLLEKIRVMDSVTKLNRARGNTKYEKFVLYN
jgi:hypothetical protein